MSEREPNFAQPWAPHRKRIYLAVAAFTGLVFGLMTISIGMYIIISRGMPGGSQLAFGSKS